MGGGEERDRSRQRERGRERKRELRESWKVVRRGVYVIMAGAGDPDLVRGAWMGVALIACERLTPSGPVLPYSRSLPSEAICG